MARTLTNWELADQLSNLGVCASFAAVCGEVFQATDCVLVHALEAHPSGEVSDECSVALSVGVNCITFAEWREVEGCSVAVNVLHAGVACFDGVNRGAGACCRAACVNNDVAAESSYKCLQTSKAFRACVVAIDGLCSNCGESRAHDAHGFDCLQSLGTVLVTSSDSLIDFDASGENEALNETLGEVRFSRIRAFVGLTECNARTTVTGHSLVGRAADRACWNDCHLRRCGGYFLNQTDDGIMSVELGKV